MVVKFVCLLAFLALAAASPPETSNARNDPNKDCPFPNGTDTKFYAYNCDDSYAIQVLSEEIYDNTTGQPMYPVDFKKKILIELISQNNGDVYDDNKADVEIAEYSYSWIHSDCVWSKIPTFGLLNNIDGCDFAHNCPLQKGPLTLMLPLDLTPFSSIIKYLTGTKPYQLTIHMYDGGRTKQIACVVAQLRFAK